MYGYSSRPHHHHSHVQSYVLEDYPGAKIRNPYVPFLATLVCGVHPGKKILIDGEIGFDLNNWVVANLCCGPNTEDNLALHISLRGNEGTVVFNDRKYGNWGYEERHAFPIACGMHGQLKIHAKHDHFKIKINGQHLSKTFHYRRPLSEITHLYVEGGIRVHEVENGMSKHHRGSYTVGVTPSPVVYTAPSSAAIQQQVASVKHAAAALTAAVGGSLLRVAGKASSSARSSRSSSPAPGYYPSSVLPIPYIAVIPGPMTIGRQIHIGGTPSLTARDVTISLKSGMAIAFHLIIDFNEGVIIRNACPSGPWGVEERHLTSAFPFNRGQPFRITLYCDYDGYKMAVNSVHMIHFAHRMTYSVINTLEVRGDLTLTEVQM